MSDLTLSAPSLPDVVDRYRAALLGLLGDSDPIAILRSTPTWISETAGRTSPGALHQPEREGKWSAADVIHHLADSDVVWSVRLRRVLAEERPALDGYNQDLWASTLGYSHRPVGPSVELFGAARRMTLSLIAAATSENLQRVGVHGERGDESIAEMIRLYAGHDVAHRNQIERILNQ
ncbi:MAG: putative metal-dependent hydrolase [Rubricoccaceae bacterium]